MVFATWHKYKYYTIKLDKKQAPLESLMFLQLSGKT